MRRTARRAAALPPICTGPRLAVQMGISRQTLWRWTNDGTIPKGCFVHIGKGHHVRYFPIKLRAAGLLEEVAHA